MWSKNNTGVWLDSKTSEEKSKIFENARRCSEKMKDKYKQRRQELVERRKEILHQKQELKIITDEKKAVQKAESVNKLLSYHVTAWLSVDEAKEKIVDVADTNKMAVVEAQLKFYENVMLSGNRSVPHKFFTKSKNSLKHTFSEMFEKLCMVIKFTISPCNDNDEAITTTLKPLDIRIDLFNESKMYLHKKITDSRQKSEIKRRNDESIPKILKDTNFFVGCTIRHLLKENNEGPETWCTGTVKSVDKYNIADPRHNKYSVEYDDDLGAQYVFPLMLDMEKGDCFIIKETEYRMGTGDMNFQLESLILPINVHNIVLWEQYGP